jgi:hypothetical protein
LCDLHTRPTIIFFGGLEVSANEVLDTTNPPNIQTRPLSFCALLSGRCRPPGMESLHYFIKVAAYRNLIVQEILEPDKVHPLSHSDKGKKVPQPHANIWFRAFGTYIVGRSVQLESHSHV